MIGIECIIDSFQPNARAAYFNSASRFIYVPKVVASAFIGLIVENKTYTFNSQTGYYYIDCS